MQFPTDPDKRPGLWSSFEAKMTKGAISFLVHSGKEVDDTEQVTLYIGSATDAVSLFRSADFARFGASGGSAIGPFFAFELKDDCARLLEFAVDPMLQSVTAEAIQDALQSVAINIFFERRDIIRILIPLDLSNWAVPEWNAVARNGGTELHRRSA